MSSTDAAPATRAEQARQTRARIIRTANRLFAERGYDGTSLQQIADEMGLTKAAVYYHFRTKTDLLRAIFDETLTQIEAMIEAAAQGGTRAERIRLLAEGFADDILARAGRPLLLEADPSVGHALAGQDERHAALLGRAAEMLYGKDPSAAEFAAVLIAATGLSQVTEALTHLEHEVKREIMVSALTRILRVR